jgi:hypothetical protein
VAVNGANTPVPAVTPVHAGTVTPLNTSH